MRRTWVVGAVVAVLGMAAPAAAVFDPAAYVGTWSGTWKNTTFRVAGTLGATVQASPDGQTLTVDYTISSLFNCGPTTFTRVLTRGVDFTDAGITLSATNPAWGTSSVTSVSRKKLEKISASGGPPCNLGIASWSLKAKLKATRLKGKMKIVFAQGSPSRATATFKAQKP
jgi:hypothetical protein